MALAPGDRIGSYRVVRALGRGGMGTVYEVEHAQLGVRYALKTFTLDHGRIERFRRRFLAEGRILARLDHPNIVRVFDLNLLGNGELAYFAMDLVLGGNGDPQTLADIGFGAANSAPAVRWFAQLASALDYIHGLGIVHRDIKLNNILLDGGDGVTLSDFGISRFEDERLRADVDLSRTRLTNADGAASGGSVMGTEGYLSPELLRGEKASFASDAYALGVTFFRLLTGLWYEPGTDALRLLDPIGGGWSEVLAQMLDPDASKRPTRLTPLAEHLRRAHGADARRSRTHLAAGLAVLVALGVIALTALRRTAPPADTADAPVDAHVSLAPTPSAPAPSPVATPVSASSQGPTPAPPDGSEGEVARTPPPNRPPETPPPAQEKEPFRIILDAEREIAVAFVECPPGEFVMREKNAPGGRERTVAIGYPFYLMSAPLTLRDVVCLDEAVGARARAAVPPEDASGETPATNLSAEDVAALAAAMTVRFPVPAEWGYECRLPTEAEREYARHLGRLSGDVRTDGQPGTLRSQPPVRLVFAPKLAP